MASDRTVLCSCLACGAYVSVTLGATLAARCPRCTCRDLEPLPTVDVRATRSEEEAPKKGKMALCACVACGAYVTVGEALWESVSCPRCACSELELIPDEGERSRPADAGATGAGEERPAIQLRKTGTG